MPPGTPRADNDCNKAEDCLQDALAVVWKKRLQIRLHPNPQALILKICLNAAYDSLRRLERMRRQTDLSQLDNAPAPPDRVNS
jgi:DNA-directed RNA polymerase specialized sigma24 family protein